MLYVGDIVDVKFTHLSRAVPAYTSLLPNLVEYMEQVIDYVVLRSLCFLQDKCVHVWCNMQWSRTLGEWTQIFLTSQRQVTMMVTDPLSPQDIQMQETVGVGII